MSTPTHDVINQPPLLAGYNAWTADAILRAAVAREGGDWVAPRALAMGELIGSERHQSLVVAANRNRPELRTHDRFGHRIDAVDFHPAYHELMSEAFGAGCHCLAWTADRPGGFVARAALVYLWNQGDQGTACPVTMTFAGVHVLKHEAAIAHEWTPKLTANSYDPRALPIQHKTGATIGMAMTEKQGGSDLRAIQTQAMDAGDGHWHLTGHKWFCSAPMSDAFLTLARTAAGVTCFIVPRSLPDGTRNRIFLQRLKDKCGNHSNASSEIEYDATAAWRIGEDGRGIPTLIEMAHLTRFDIVVAAAGMQRAMLNQALHHCTHRSAFGRLLVSHPLMQNVLADLAIEVEAATVLAFRLARAFDRATTDPLERLAARVMVPVAKYWLCKRLPSVAVEAMECLGGNGYVEESPLARLYREAPLNGIWEGSSNVICLDVLRTLQKEPEALAALMDELRECVHASPALGAHLDRTAAMLATPDRIEPEARRIVERVALALQAALLIRNAPAMVADAFCTTRLVADSGYAFGTLASGTDFAAIIDRARLLG